MDDNYKHWEKHYSEKDELFLREKTALNLLYSIVSNAKNLRLLDLGCADGGYLRLLLDTFDIKGIGLEHSPSLIELAKQKNLDIIRCDLDNGLPFIKPDSFDIVYAAEIIEHLVNPDKFIHEIFRVITPGGYTIITTPNLQAWYNRILFFFGMQPVFMEFSTENKMVGAGILRHLKNDETPVGHIRVFTLRAITDLLNREGFEIVKVRSAAFDAGLPKWLLPLDKLFARLPSLGSNLVILAQKPVMSDET